MIILSAGKYYTLCLGPSENTLSRTLSGMKSRGHILLVCPLLQNVCEKYGISDIENGVMNDAFLIEMECILGIKR